jgi:cystathionine gamma-synthase
MKLETLAVKAGAHAAAGSGAIAPPITLSTIFERGSDGSFPGGYFYGRSGNPNRTLAETRLAALEGGEAAFAFSSGSAAAAAVFQCLAPGDRVVAPRDLYHGVRRLLSEVMTEWRLEVEFVEMTALAEVDAALARPTRLLWIDSPSNPLLSVTDIRAVAERAHAAGALCAVDNTFATPILQRPLALGADLVVHSTTKYIGGHSDVTGGAVIVGAGSPLAARLKRIQELAGAVPSPFDAWLVARGIATLPYRMRAHAANAAAVAEGLTKFPSVSEVIYPGLASHPGHAIAARQMSGFGGMISFRAKGGRDAAFGALGRLKLITRATSLGGVESTIEHRRSMEGPTSPTPDDLIRMAVGLEHPDDLLADLAQAFG